MPLKFKSAVMKSIACPRCGEKYELSLASDETTRKGIATCLESTNKAMANASGFIWCGAVVAYEISRSYTYVAAVHWQKQPNKFRRVTEEGLQKIRGGA